MSAEHCKKCGISLRRGGLIYWIDFMLNGVRKREMIGPSKAAAELRHSEIKKSLIEERDIKKDKTNKICLSEAVQWYLELNTVKAKRSFKRDVQMLENISRVIGPASIIGKINYGTVEEYRISRLNEESKYSKTGLITPSTVNKEVAALVTLFNRMVDHGVIEQNPIRRKITKLEEDNIRNKSLKIEKFKELLSFTTRPLTEMLNVAFYTAMRQGEILKLQWSQVDFEAGIITIPGTDTKNSSTRKIPIHPELKRILLDLKSVTESRSVISCNGKSINSFHGGLRKKFDTARMFAGLDDLLFHDIRHVATNMFRKSVEDPHKLKTITGHKSDRALNRYIYVPTDELQEINWNFN